MLASTSITQVEIQAPGTTAGTDYDVINVSGQVRGALAAPTNWGVLDVLHLGGFSPAVASSFTIMNYAHEQREQRIAGSGTLNLGAGTLTNNGIVSPGTASGDTTGTLTITGNLVQGTGGIVPIEIEGNGLGQSDVLAVSGTALLAGTLNVSHLGGFTPAPGNAFSILTYASASGDFATKNFPVGFTYTGTPNLTNYHLPLEYRPKNSGDQQ